MILGRKHIYLPHAQNAIYDSKVKLFLKQGISHQLGRDAVVRFECENSAIDVIINLLWKIFHKPIVLVVLTTANFGGFSNFCWYYTRSQTGKSTGYLPTLKPLVQYYITLCDDYKIFKFVSFSCVFFSDFIDNHRFTGHLSHNDKGMN